jgi:hypothetical protein
MLLADLAKISWIKIGTLSLLVAVLLILLSSDESEN